MVETNYRIRDQYQLTLAVIADLHFRKIEKVLRLLQKRRPDYILIPGDLVDGVLLEHEENHPDALLTAVNLLNRLAEIAPTYFSLGNHEKWFTPEELEALTIANVQILRERFVPLDGKNVYIGGLSSGRDYRSKKAAQTPQLEFLNEFEKTNGFKILLSHHPEYYEMYLKDREIDLIVSGHAHGGQIRIGNQGLYAPGQGLLPKYTSGVHDGRLIISRGIAGTERFPRIHNKPEIVYITI